MNEVKHIAIDINHNHWQNGFVRQRDTKGLTSVKEFYHVLFLVRHGFGIQKREMFFFLGMNIRTVWGLCQLHLV